MFLLEKPGGPVLARVVVVSRRVAPRVWCVAVRVPGFRDPARSVPGLGVGGGSGDRSLCARRLRPPRPFLPPPSCGTPR